MMIKAIKVIRNNWKKSLFFSGLTLWGSNYLYYKIKCYNIMKAYCEEAQKYGQDKLDPFHQPRHITVILNPVACNKKGKLKYEKYAAPLFHLAGLRVSLIQTEREGQAKDLMEIMDNTDAIVIAGGNGTMHEAVTGLLRRSDQGTASQKWPIGLIPIGKRNTIFKRFSQQDDDGLEVKLAESAMAVIRETIKQIDVMKIEGKQQGKGKPVFSLDGLDYGNFRDSLSRVNKYWWFGPQLKPYLALIMNPQGLSKNLNITYSLPCDGCNKCYSKFIPTISKNEPKRWWHMFLSRREITDPSKVIDYYKNIDNPDCGKWIDIGSVNTANLFIKNTNQHKIQLNIFPEKLGSWEYIKTGVKFYNSQMNNQQLEDEIVKKIEANDVRIQLNDGNDDEQDNHDDNDNKNDWFSIDTENYEAQSIQVNLLPKKLKIYSN